MTIGMQATEIQSVGFDPKALASISYDECVERLAHAVDRQDDAGLEEVARLIGQLAVVIEI
jgi:hypothetical protein